ncbi:MAG: hypothetical protein DRI81_18905, partial [Chloroflexi bacterium]
ALVTRMCIPEKWRERILAYLHYDEGMAQVAYERESVRQRLQRAAELYDRGHYTRDKLARVEVECRRQSRAIEPDATPAGQDALALLDNLPALWEALTDEEQNNLYRILLNGVYVRGKAIAEIEPQRPFQTLLEEAARRLVGETGAPLPYDVVDDPGAPDPELVALLERT